VLDSVPLCATVVHVSSLKRFTIWTIGAEIFQILYIWIYLPISESAVYGTNDDALLASISGGQLTGAPDGHLVFVNPLISFPISWLQVVFDQFNIFSLFLTLSATISFALLFGLISIQNQLNNLYKLVIYSFWILSMVTFISWFALAPTYTGASIFLAGTSASFTYMYLYHNQKFKNTNSALLLTMVLMTFFLSILIRRESIFIFLFFLVIILISKIKNLKYLTKKMVILLGSGLFLLSINIGSEKLVYDSDEWSDYYKTNSLRHKIQLRSAERQLEDKYLEVGWNRSNLDLFNRFILIDKDFMNEQNMSKIIEVTKDNSLNKLLNFFNVSNFIGNTKIAFAAWTWIVMLFAYQFLIILVNKENSTRRNEFLFLSLLLVTAVPSLYLLLNIFYQLPDRISVSLMAASSIFIITLGLDDIRGKNSSSKIFLYTQVVFALVVSSLFIQRLQTELSARSELYKSWISIGDQQSNSLSNLDKEIIVIGSASSIKSEWQNPYLKFSSLDARNRTIILGWHNLSPIWAENIDSYGLNKAGFFLNLTKPNVYWATNKDDSFVMQEYLSEKLNKNVLATDLGPIGYQQYHYFKF
jgi:hypothetical protein